MLEELSKANKAREDAEITARKELLGKEKFIREEATTRASEDFNTKIREQEETINKLREQLTTAKQVASRGSTNRFKLTTASSVRSVKSKLNVPEKFGNLLHLRSRAMFRPIEGGARHLMMRLRRRIKPTGSYRRAAKAEGYYCPLFR